MESSLNFKVFFSNKVGETFNKTKVTVLQFCTVVTKQRGILCPAQQKAHELETDCLSYMAEVHVFGQIVSASGFHEHSVSCKWKLSFGNNWKAVEGLTEGLTQLDNPQSGLTSFLCHPLDVHFLTSGLQGWPKFHFEVWQQDTYGRSSPAGYGLLHLPVTPGRHQIQCLTWRPVGSLTDEVVSLFTSGGLRLEDTDILSQSSDRFRLQTESSGKICLDLYIITRNFDRFGIETA
jgi:B9 domain-containing protein 2